MSLDLLINDMTAVIVRNCATDSLLICVFIGSKYEVSKPANYFIATYKRCVRKKAAVKCFLRFVERLFCTIKVK